MTSMKLFRVLQQLLANLNALAVQIRDETIDPAGALIITKKELEEASRILIE